LASLQAYNLKEGYMSREWSRVREPQQSNHVSANSSTSDSYDSLLDESIPLKPKNPWWRRRRWQAIIIVVVVALVLIKVVPSSLNSSGPQVLYQYQKVTQGDLALSITATGPVQGKVYNVDFENSGKLKEIDVKLNQQVKADQLLAKLDSTLLQDQINQAQQNVTQSEGDSQAMADAQAQLKAAQDKLNSATLTAPHAGTVTAINGTVGSAPGANTAMGGGSGSSSFMQITDEASLQVQAYVNEADVGRVSKGQHAQFTVSAYGQQPFYGTVDSISSTGVIVSNVVTYPMTINVDMKRLQGVTLFPGMTADVTVQTLKHSNVLLIPQSTVNVIHAAVAHNFISQDQVNTTTSEARHMLAASGSTSTKDAPTPTCVLVLVEKQWMLKPVLLGLTDGTVYEVIQGLSSDQTIMTDIQNSSNTNSTLAFNMHAHIKQ